MRALQALTADQQVALLFVILFGVLLLVSGSSGLFALRERSLKQDQRLQQFQRELRAVWLGAVVFWITPFNAAQALAMAAIAGATGTSGELVMSALKRDAGVRFWGNTSSVTGAVGLLDRVAPLCFAAPVFFHSVRWYFQLKA